LHRTLQAIKELGVKAGVTLNPATPLSTVENILEDADLLLVMSVNPGFGGQSFIPKILDKLVAARRMIDERGLKVELEVDGGIKVENIRQIAATGVDIFVAGSAVFESKNYKETLSRMRQAINPG
jgi:ribulose-phosphate 3-epimerase